MFGLRRQWFAVSLLSIALTGCDPTQPTAPRIQDQSAASPQTTVNAPSNLSATAASQTRIELAWKDNSSNETGFEIRRSTTGPDGSFPVIATTGASATSYPDTGLSLGTQYCYEVRAFSVGRKTTSYSTSTAPACATTLAPPVPPGPPQAPEYEIAGSAGSHAVAIWWVDRASNEDGFRVERSADSGATWVTAATTTANIGSITDRDRESEVQVCYRVSAFNAEGVSAPSNTACATPLAGPTDLALDESGLLTWTDNSALEDGYEVWMMMDSWGYAELIAVLPPNTTSYQTGGCGGSCYGFIVVAVKDGASSDPAVVSPPPAIP